MAIHSTSLLNPPPLPPMADGVEFYITECENVNAPFSTLFDGPAERFRACAVMVSFARSHAERAAFLPLQHALAFGQTSSAVCDGAEWLQKLPKRLSELLKSTGHDMVVAVIYTGSDGDSSAESVQATANALRQCFGASLAALLVVADTSSHQLRRVTDVSGFVIGATGTSAETARSVFLCLAMFTAPKTLNGIDIADLLPVLGTAAELTVLVDTVWLRSGSGSLVFASALDAEAQRCAVRLVAVPMIDGSWFWSELRQLCEAVRGPAVDASSKVFFEADGALAPGLFPAQVSMVPILCATARLPGAR